MSALQEHVEALNAATVARWGGEAPAPVLEPRAALLAALEGLDLDERELRYARWLFEWDGPTLRALAGIVRKAREHPGPSVESTGSP